MTYCYTHIYQCISQRSSCSRWQLVQRVSLIWSMFRGYKIVLSPKWKTHITLFPSKLQELQKREWKDLRTKDGVSHQENSISRIQQGSCTYKCTDCDSMHNTCAKARMEKARFMCMQSCLLMHKRKRKDIGRDRPCPRGASYLFLVILLPCGFGPLNGRS